MLSKGLACTGSGAQLLAKRHRGEGGEGLERRGEGKRRDRRGRGERKGKEGERSVEKSGGEEGRQGGNQ